MTRTDNCIIFYARGRDTQSGDEVTFITVELLRSHLYVRARITGDFAIVGDGHVDSMMPVRKSLYFSYQFPTEIALNSAHEVTITLRKENFVVYIDDKSESFYFLVTLNATSDVEVSLIQLPADLLTGIIFFGGMPIDMWSAARSSRHTQLNRRYMLGCITQLLINSAIIRYNDVLAIHQRISAEWIISSTCQSNTQITCAELHCQPYATCVNRPNGQAYCECSGTAMSGDHCDNMPEFGYYCGRSGIYAGVYLVNSFVKRTWTMEDSIAVGVLTNYSEGTLLRIENLVGTVMYVEVRLKSGRLFVDYINERRKLNVTLPLPETTGLTAAEYTVIKLHRRKDVLVISVYTREDQYFKTEGVQLAGIEGFSSGKFRISLCGRLSGNITSYFTGIVSGLEWNSVNLFEFGRSNSSRKRELRGDVVEVHPTYQLYPWPCYGIFSLVNCSDSDGSLLPLSPKRKSTRRTPLVIAPPLTGYGDALYVGFDSGRIERIMVALDGGIPIAWIEAFAVISAILLFGAAIGSIYANGLANCFLPPAAALAPETVPLSSAADNADDIGTAKPSDVRSAPPPAVRAGDMAVVGVNDVRSHQSAMMPIANNYAMMAHNAAMPYVYTMPVPVMVMPVPYLANQPIFPLQHSRPLEQIAYDDGRRSGLRITEIESRPSSANRGRQSAATMRRSATTDMRFGGTETIFEKKTLTLDRSQSQTFRSATSINMPGLVEIGDEYKVSCFVATTDSQFVVTGSSCGPPQFWSLETGEVCRVFQDAAHDDYSISAHELHLACNDTMLVGEISVDRSLIASRFALDVPTNYRRLQIWRMADGSALSMPCLLYCTASNLLNNKQYVVAAALDNEQNVLSVCLWNVLLNEPAAFPDRRVATRRRHFAL